MLDFEVHRCSRRCSQTERELKPGEPVYSVLVGKGSSVVRLDYAKEAWNGPPDESIGWWKSIVPDANGPRVQWAPNDVMVHFFEQLEGSQQQQDLRYVLALLLIRRRIVRLEESVRDEKGQETLVVYSPRSERQYRVLTTLATPERNRQIQDELAKLLFDGVIPASMTPPSTPAPEEAPPADAPIEVDSGMEALSGLFSEPTPLSDAPASTPPNEAEPATASTPALDCAPNSMPAPATAPPVETNLPVATHDVPATELSEGAPR